MSINMRVVEIYRSSMFFRHNNKRVCFPVLIIILAILASTCMAAVDDEDPLFATLDLEKELCARFRLKPKEISVLRPLIKLDNRNAALLYITAANAHETDYMFLWDRVRRFHVEFDASMEPGLNLRQRSVLKLAHSEFETRIVTLWMDDYVGILADALDLDSVQLSVVRVVFDVERDHRRRSLLRLGLMSDAEFDAEWDRMTNDREDELLKIFSVEQVRSYRSLTAGPKPLIASLTAGGQIKRPAI